MSKLDTTFGTQGEFDDEIDRFYREVVQSGKIK